MITDCLGHVRIGMKVGGRMLFELLRVIDIFLILIVLMVSLVYIYFKTHQVVFFKCVQYIICHLYLNEAVKFYF